MVKEIVLSSWTERDIKDPEHEHLNQIKRNVDFYPFLDAHLSFDLAATLEQRKEYWDRYFPGARQDGKGKSERFVEILEARHQLGVEKICYDEAENVLKLEIQHPEPALLVIDDISLPLAFYLREEQVAFLTSKRNVYNAVYGSYCEVKSYFSREEITVMSSKDLINAYFPELFKS